MRFISAQAVTIVSDDNGKDKFITPSEVEVPIHKSLGFSPLWAVPITTFKETMASMVLTAPNNPQMCLVFETDDYARIDKVKHYENIMLERYGGPNGADLPLAPDDMPDYLVEYCLNRKTLNLPEITSFIQCINSFERGTGDVLSSIDFKLKSKGEDVSDLNYFVNEIIKSTNGVDVEPLIKKYTDKNYDNPKGRANMTYCWYKYKYTILPLILQSMCIDTNDSRDNGRFRLDLAYIQACAYNVNSFYRMENDFAFWSHDDCSIDGYERIYNNFKDAVIDSTPVLERVLTKDKIGRNETCPCDSGKKFKKCHGFYF